MSARSKVLVELGRIAYISSAARTAESLRARNREIEERTAREAELERCNQRRRQLADDLLGGGKAGKLQGRLGYDRNLANMVDRQVARLVQATDRQAEAERRLEENREETRRKLARLRLAENLLQRERKALIRRREGKREEGIRVSLGC